MEQRRSRMLEMLALLAHPLVPPSPDRFIDSQALRTLQVIAWIPAIGDAINVEVTCGCLQSLIPVPECVRQNDWRKIFASDKAARSMSLVDQHGHVSMIYQDQKLAVCLLMSAATSQSNTCSCLNWLGRV